MKRTRIAAVLRHAAQHDGVSLLGIHAAISELDAHDIADDVWRVFYAAEGASVQATLLEAARRVEAAS